MVSITSQAPHFIHNPMDLLKNVSKLSRTVFHKVKEEGKDLFKCLTDLLQLSFDKQFTISYADYYRLDVPDQRCCNVKCSKETAWFGPRVA